MAGLAPARWRRDVAVALATALRARAPGRLWVTGEVELQGAGLDRRRPDLMVVFDDGFDRQTPRLRPSQVLLVADVTVSAGGASSAPAASVGRAYAGAGIEHYWLLSVAPEQSTVHTCRLADQEAYSPTGVFTGGDVVDAPGLDWADIRVADLPVPRLLGTAPRPA